MSMAIDFAVRSVAGGTTYGQVSGPDQGNFIQTGAGDSISLNLRPESILSYRNVDGDLLIELADGRTILLADYFSTPDGALNTLYLSTNGEIVPVTLIDVGDGIMAAELGPTSAWAKWSPLDDLRFTDGDPTLAMAGEGTDEPAGMGLFVPGLLGAGGAGLGAGAALLGGAALIGGGGGGGGGGGNGGGGGGGGNPTDPRDLDGDGRIDRTVNGRGNTNTITTNTNPPAIAVTGTGEPGDTVVVTIGTQSQNTTVGANGTWSTTFTGPTLPADGNHTASAVFTGNGSTATITGPAFVIDMTPPPITVTDGFQSTGDVENLAEYADGVTLTGTTEPGATVMITVNTPGSQPRPATVQPDGSWSITLTQAEIAGGERTQGITITATDALGNVRTTTETVVLDTVPPPLGLNPIAVDNVVNLSESQGTIVIGGTATANTTISLTIEGLPGPIPITVDGNGNWSHGLSRGVFTDGTYPRQITATTQDAAGNPTTITRTLNIDTQMAVDFGPGPIAVDNVVNLSESNGTIALSGTVARDATRVEVQWLGQPVPATINTDGTWSLTLPAGAAGTVSRESTITVTAWDAAGNRDTADRPLRIDLETAVTMEPQPVGADNILSGSERTAGLTLDGTAEPGARVFVTINGSERPHVIADAQGNWSILFNSADLPTGQTANGLTFSAYSIDPAGNRSETVSRSFGVDTLVQDFGFAAPDLTGTVSDGARDPQVLNATERSQGLLVQGTVEPGSSVMLQLGNWSHTIPASATQNGTWTFRIPENALPSGPNANATITATATDARGNISAPLSQTIAIDTQVTDFNANQVRLGTGNDNILNAVEHQSGMPVSGRAEAGSTIRVTLGATTHDVVADAQGNWTVNFTSAQLPTGERSGIPVSVTATDTAGNVSGPHVLTFDVDTVLPATPQVIETQDIPGFLRGITTSTSPDSYNFHRVDATGAAQPVAAQESTTFRREDRFEFATEIPDGSYLVINTRDTAGNEANTLFIKNTATGVTVDLARDGLDAFDFTAIDLTRAPDARLSISEAQLRDLTGPDQTLIIKGETTDQVTLTGVTNVRENVDLPTGRFDIYTLGNNGATVILEDDVSRTVV